MAFQVLITECANEDLRQIVEHISQHNPAAASRVGYALIDRLKMLRDFPYLGRVVPERGELNLRELVLPPYRIVYRVRGDRQMVEVLRFWHAARGAPEV